MLVQGRVNDTHLRLMRRALPMNWKRRLAGAVLVMIATASPAGFIFAQEDSRAVQALSKLGIQPTRQADFDLCLPATAEEYEAIGKYAILRIEARSVLSTELPLRAAYLRLKDLSIPLRLIVAFEKRDNQGSAPLGQADWHQVGFYLVPINLLKQSPELMIDFTGQRRGFGIGTLSVSDAAPAFVRLDEYDNATEPNEKAIAGLLYREYPKDFKDR
jgi:hypothetical protein